MSLIGKRVCYTGGEGRVIDTYLRIPATGTLYSVSVAKLMLVIDPGPCHEDRNLVIKEVSECLMKKEEPRNDPE